MRFEIAEFDESIFLSAAPTALWEKQHKIIDVGFARAILTARRSDVEKISAEIAAENSENS